MHQNYKDAGLEIVGFPCNQFGGQEPGTNLEIRVFARETYKAEFPLMAKSNVNGPDANDVYKMLRMKSSLFNPRSG